MFAVLAAIQLDQDGLQNSQILLQTDNRTVVSYINKEGGTQSLKLLEQTRRLLSVLDKVNMHLIAQYIPGRYNVEVDALSRQKACPEWHLITEATTKIFQMWGCPEIDFFASKTAHVVRTYGTCSLEPGQRTPCYNSSEMAKGVLPIGSSEPSLISNSRSEPCTSRHANRNTPTGSSKITTGSLADFGWQEILTGWTESEQRLLRSSWRDSTLNTYKPAWIRWKKWCDLNSVDHKFPNGSRVARYLAHLHCDIGLAYRTILVHKSVDLSSDFFIKHILRAISISREKLAKPPIWNPKKLLDYVSSHNPNKNSLFDVSRHAATLASGRRIHDLTLLRIDNQSLLYEEGDLIFWPAFGSKTDNANHRRSGWRLKPHPIQNLNTNFWIKRVLTLSSDRRKDLNHLFITPRAVVKPASRTMIGGWVKSLLKDADIEASPGSVKSTWCIMSLIMKNIHELGVLYKSQYKESGAAYTERY
ncbi:uncharacterized protein LOC133320416 [Danaus plexippus]|uniref:uncharacterized protein LOC133320416 n=1 Tax=Danaus plexippus TaxID=13037 RepID=UPI002AB055CF|nr:uncharacterized protein LOC133320416 [Danaus plexippus]